VQLTSVTRRRLFDSGGGPGALTLDVLTPATPGPKPLVIYVPGGGFVQADKGGALGLRTYVAESGYVVASIRYRTSPTAHATSTVWPT